MQAPQHHIADYYAQCFAKHGDTHLGANWPKANDVDTRYRVMMEFIPKINGSIRILDFGCGTGNFYTFLKNHYSGTFEYMGLDINPTLIARAQEKNPHVEFYCQDILRDPSHLPTVDLIVANGVFTVKHQLSQTAMNGFMHKSLQILFQHTKCGLAFNVMSTIVDWEREDLYHCDMSQLAIFLAQNISRHFVFRNDYGLYEFTCCVYQNPLERVS